jgi:ketopantoate reductase
MKILVFGAGVIGISYAWQLSEAGYDVSLLVRKHKLVRYSHSGVNISCTDLRKKKNQFVKTVYRPRTTDRLDPNAGYDLIVVSVKNTQIGEAIAYIARYAGDASVLCLCNLWNGFETIQQQLPPHQTFFGYPSIVGGGKSDNGINCLIFKNRPTILGTPTGQSGRRLNDIIRVLDKSGLRPKISKHIITWLKAQAAFTAASYGAVSKAGDTNAFTSNFQLIKQLALATREGFRVCVKEKANPLRIHPFSLFYLPLFIITPLLKRYFHPDMTRSMEGRMKHGLDEMRKQYADIMKSAAEHGVHAPYLGSFEKYIQETEKSKSRIS